MCLNKPCYADRSDSYHQVRFQDRLTKEAFSTSAERKKKTTQNRPFSALSNWDTVSRCLILTKKLELQFSALSMHASNLKESDVPAVQKHA